MVQKHQDAVNYHPHNSSFASLELLLLLLSSLPLDSELELSKNLKYHGLSNSYTAHSLPEAQMLRGYRFQVLSLSSVLVVVFLSIHSCHCSSQSDANEEICYSFDAFLGFRGADVRYGFVDHLYTAQVQAGILVFKDDRRISLGENIDSRIEHVIRYAKVSVVVISKAFANSTYCLNELVIMMQQLETVGQVVIPIFYHVDPSDVVAQSGPFREAFAGYEKHLKDMKEMWKEHGRNAAQLASVSPSNGSLELTTFGQDYCLGHIATLKKEAEDFSKKLEGWKAALKGVEPLSGEVIKEGSDEAQAVENIVEHVKKILLDQFGIDLHP